VVHPAIPDVRDPLRKLRVEGSVLDGTAAARRGDAPRLVAGDAARHPGSGGELPLLAMLAGALVEAEKEETEIGRTVDDHGLVRDEASPLLYRTRREIKSARNRLVEKLAAYVSSLPAHYQVPDASVTVREGRFVIPIRREGRGEVGGIVHDESGTGATLFVEPPVAVR
jgi:DNA mismatch repair protein MutS2